MTARTVSDDQQQILRWISELHAGPFECDVTYGSGSFWKGWAYIPHKFDLHPRQSDVLKADSAHLPIPDACLRNLVFDPPFLLYVKEPSVMSNRFSGYWSTTQLEKHYRDTLVEAKRVLKPKGVMVFKCQDTIHNHKLYSIHNKIINWAEALGFRLLDLYILTANTRMPVKAAAHGVQKQRHARSHHCYFLVLKRGSK